MVKPTLYSGNDAENRRMTGGRLAAAFFMMLAMIGTMITFLDDAGYEYTDWPPAIVAAAVIGIMAGWSQLGRNLGRDFMLSGMFGVGAGLIGLTFFALVFGFRSAWITHFGVGFTAAIDVVAHILDTGIKVIQTFFASSRTILALGMGSLCAGIIAEYFNRIWK